MNAARACLNLVSQHELFEGLKVHKGHQQVQHLLHDLISATVQVLHDTTRTITFWRFITYLSLRLHGNKRSRELSISAVPVAAQMACWFAAVLRPLLWDNSYLSDFELSHWESEDGFTGQMLVACRGWQPSLQRLQL